MLPQLEHLLVVQDRDQTLQKCRKQLTALPKERLMLEARLAQAKADFEASKSDLQQNEVARHQLEIEEQSKRDTIAKYKTQMMQTRKNEEYQAFMHEIAQAEAAINNLEDRELQLLEELDAIRPVMQAAEQAFHQQQTEIHDALAALDQRAAALANRIESVTAERGSLIQSIDPPLLELYEALFKSKGDAAVVPLEHGTCGGCHMSVTLTISHAVMADREIIQCNNCGRILHRTV